MARPLSSNEKKSAKKDETIIVYNISKQSIAIQLMPPINPKTGKRISFWTAEQSIMIPHGKSARFERSRLYMDQIGNLQKSGMLRIKTISA